MPPPDELAGAVGDAVSFAAAAHGGQLRRTAAVDRPVSYLCHLLAVGATVIEFGGDTDTAVAAVLHDVVEDTDVGVAELASRFGPRVASLVEACTDTLPGDAGRGRASWERRKAVYLDHLREEDDAVALIAVADKLHNVTSLLDAVQAHGPAVLSRFNAPPSRLLWYHRQVQEAVGERIPAVLAARYGAAIAGLERIAGAAAPADPAPG